MKAENTISREAQAVVDSYEKRYWKDVGKKIIKDWRLYVMVLPLFLVFLFWRYFPMYELVGAFKEDNEVLSIAERQFTGFFQFQQLLSSSQYAPMFWRALRNTFVISFYGLIFGFPFPIILALMFNEVRSNGYRSVLQVASYLPKFMSTVVMTTLTILLLKQGSTQFHEPPGVLSTFMMKLGWITEETAYEGLLNETRYFRAIYQVMGIWEDAGYGSIVYFAAIIGISPTSYEAARIDGASKMAQIRYVVLPSILSTVVIMLIIRIGGLLNVGYERVYLLASSSNKWETAEIIQTLVMKFGSMVTGSDANSAALASAADMLNAIISMLLVIGANMVSKNASNTSLY